MPKSGSYFYPGLNGNIAVGTYRELAIRERSDSPGTLDDYGFLFVSGSGVNQQLWFKNEAGNKYALAPPSASIDLIVIDEFDVKGVLTSSTNDNQIKFSSSIDFLNDYPNFHLNARNSHLVLSSSAGSLVLVSGSFTVVETTTTSDLTVSDVIDVAGYLSSSTNTKIDSSSSIDFLNVDKDYHINARNSHLVLSSSAGSHITISGSLFTEEHIDVGNRESTITIDGTTLNSKVNIHTEGATDLAGLLLQRNSDNAAFGSHVILSRTRGSEAAETATQTDDKIGRVIGAAYDGTEHQIIGQIAFEAEGNTTDTSAPGRISFYTTEVNSVSETERYRIDSSGRIIAPNSNIILSSSAGSDVVISGNIDLQSGSLKYVRSIQFDTSTQPEHVEGQIHWNGDDFTLDFDTEVIGTSIQLGQEQVVRATNKEGYTINNGQVVYVSGAQGNRPIVYLASNLTGANVHSVIGLATQDIEDNQTGYITTSGLVRDINTTGTPYSETWTEGDVIYIGEVTGSLTNVEPISPKHAAKVGYILNAHATQGIVLVHVDIGHDLECLHDVLILTASHDDLLSYNSSSLVWENKTVSYVNRDYVLRNQWDQNGFTDASSELSMSWDDANRQLVVQPISTSFSYYLSGVLYTETGSFTSSITNDEGLWVFYFSDQATVSNTLNPSHDQIDTVIENYSIIAYTYWDATNGDGRLMYEPHGARMSPATHHWIHDNVGAVYKTGMALNTFNIDAAGDDDTHAQFGVDAGEFYDEDIEHNLSAVVSTTGLEIWYLDGSNWRWTTNAGFSVLTTGTGRLAFNDSGTQTEVGNNNFVLCHVFATNIVEDGGINQKYIAIQGQNSYGNITSARAGAETEINTLIYGTLPLQEIVPVATVIFQTSNGYTNSVKARIRTTDAGDDYIDWRSSNIKASGGSIADHGALAGLSDDDHPYNLYLLGRSGGQTITGGLDASDDLRLHSTANATKGNIYFGSNSVYDEVNDRLGINDTTPTETLEVNGNTIISGSLQVTGQILSGGLKIPNLTGTPANNQLAIWTDADTLEGDSNLFWDGSELVVTGNIENQGNTIISGSLQITGQILSGGLKIPNLTGTPVDNQIAIWTDADTLEGDANLTWDGTNLGIGKTPTETLEVNGNTIISGSLQITGQILSGGLKIPNLTGTPANNQIAVWTDADTLEGDANLFWDGSELVVTGNIELNGTVDGRDIATDGTNQDNHIADNTLHFTEGSIDHTAIQNIGTNTHVQIDTHISTNHVNTFNSRTGNVTPATNDYTWAQINKATSDIADITTKSHTSLTDIGTNTHAQIDTHIASTSNPHSVTFTQAVTADAGTDISAAECETLTDNSIADALHRHSELVASDGSPDPAVTVDAAGQVGIGTSTPTETLEVNGNTIISGSLQITGQILSGGLKIPNLTGTPANNQIAVWTDADTLEGDADLTWDGSTLIALGDIKASGFIQGASGGSGTAFKVGNDATIEDIGVGATIGIYGVSGGGATEGGIKFGSGGPTLYGKSNNLGIGTTSPTEKLELFPNTDVSAIIGRAHIGQIVGIPADYAGFAHIDQAGAAGTYALLQDASGRTLLNAATGQSVRVRINNADAVYVGSDKTLTTLAGAVFNENSGDYDFRVESNGNTHMLFVSGNDNCVGIGTSTPTETLEVNGNTIISGSLQITGQILSGGLKVPNLTGTPANNQIAIWTDADTLEGDADLTWDGNKLYLSASTTETRTIEIGSGRSGDGNSLLDFIGDATYKDYGLRFLRNPGANGNSTIIHRGTGEFNFTALDSGGEIVFNAIGERIRMGSYGSIFNENSADIDFRVESNGQEYMLFVDGGADAVGIGESTPDASSILEITSTTKGFLPPRMTDVQKAAISSPAAGLMVYNTNSGSICMYDGSNWKLLMTVAD